MHKASIALAAGADFTLLGPRSTMLNSVKPVIAVTAVRTGCGKSQTSRAVGRILRSHGLSVALVRHPMPYGDLEAMRVQRFGSLADIDAANPTVEEREEYEAPVELGMVMYAGVDYAQILEQAQAEADVIIWDGGNNDFPFYAPDVHIVVVDPLRAGHELTYHPGEVNLRMADVVVVNKVDTAEPADVLRVVADVERVNPTARVVYAKSPVQLQAGEDIRGKRVLVVDDGPTLTHGGMAFGAGTVAARNAGAASLCRSAAVRGRDDQGHARAVAAPRRRAAGDGLLGQPAPRPAGDDQRRRLRRRRHRDADRPEQADRVAAPDQARDLRPRRGRASDAGGGARSDSRHVAPDDHRMREE